MSRLDAESRHVLTKLQRARLAFDEADEIKQFHSESVTRAGGSGSTSKDTREALDAIRQTLASALEEELGEEEANSITNLEWSSEAGRSRPDENRWGNVWPWNHSLLPGPYLNASTLPCLPSPLLPLPTSQPYVAAQAPLPNTFPSFYHHLLATRATLLVNLTPEFDASRGFRMRKGHRYWPKSVGKPMSLGKGWTVELTEESKDEKLLEAVIGVGNGNGAVRRFDPKKDWVIVKRLLKVTPPDGWQEGERYDFSAPGQPSASVSPSPPPPIPRIITMLHVEDWSDGGDAAADNFARLVELVAAHQREQQGTPRSPPQQQAVAPPRPPIWIHCSAGIGRTGTLIGGLMARDLLLPLQQQQQATRPTVDEEQERCRRMIAGMPALALTLRIWSHMRSRRAGLVTTAEQARMILSEIERIRGAAGAARTKV